MVAVEAGKVRIYSGSGSAGCMLYLYGASGTTYLYIHLNNDLTAKNDNKGSCKPGIAFAEGLRDGQRVRGGQLIGYVGDSGDANGVGHHLHFELHPGNRSAVSPYPWLRRANQVLFPYTPSLRKPARLRHAHPDGEAHRRRPRSSSGRAGAARATSRTAARAACAAGAARRARRAGRAARVTRGVSGPTCPSSSVARTGLLPAGTPHSEPARRSPSASRACACRPEAPTASRRP